MYGKAGMLIKVFSLKILARKYMEKRKHLYVASMDLEKTYIRVDRNVLLVVLRQYELHRRLMEVIKIRYEGI